MRALTVVFFHVDIGTTHPYAKLQGKTILPLDFAAVLESSIHAVRRSSPNAKIVVLSDESSAIPQAVECIRSAVDKDRLMYARMQACRAYAASGHAEGPILFLDTDVHLQRDFRPVFDGSFEIGLTYRVDPSMPVNEGVIFTSSSARAVAFFDILLGLYDAIAEVPQVKAHYGFDVRMWRGGQLSLASFVAGKVPPACPQYVELDGLKIRFFPCDDFNYAPAAGESPKDWASKWAIHFKGDRKTLIAS